MNKTGFNMAEKKERERVWEKEGCVVGGNLNSLKVSKDCLELIMPKV